MQNKHSKAINLGVSLKTFQFPLLEQKKRVFIKSRGFIESGFSDSVKTLNMNFQ